MTSILDHLSELAEKATPGPYFATESCAVFADGYNLIADTFCGVGDGSQRCEAPWPQPQCRANAAFIAAMDPVTALKLVAVAGAAVVYLAANNNLDRSDDRAEQHAAENAEVHAFKALQDAVNSLEKTKP